MSGPSTVIVKYLLFCLGAGFIQLASARQPDSDSLALGTVSLLRLPVIFVDPRFRLLVSALALVAWATEIVLGVLLIGWWAGLFLWIPAPLVAHVLVGGRPNPGPPFLIGLALTILAGVSFAV